MNRYYESRADTYDSESPWMSGDKELLEAHLAEARSSPVKAILDIATGTGVMATFLGQGIDTVIGIDVSPNMLQVAKGKGLSVILGTAEWLPFRESAFDLVVCRQGLHYMNVKRVFKEMQFVGSSRTLISEIVCLSKVDVKWWREIFRRLSPGRKAVFTEKSLTKAIRKAGYRSLHVRRCRTRNSLMRWIGPREFTAQQKKQLMSTFESAPATIRHNYHLKRDGGDFSYSEPWVIISASA